MNEDLQLEVVDLGNAKEATKGSPIPPLEEDNPVLRYQPIP